MKLTLDQVKTYLSNIRSAPSGIQMSSDKGYKFEVVGLSHENPTIDGFLIRCGFWRPDTNTGEMGEGWGRWTHVPSYSTEDSVVKSGYVAIKLVVEHEMMEAFEYKGVKVFDPHKDLKGLAYPKELPS